MRCAVVALASSCSFALACAEPPDRVVARAFAAIADGDLEALEARIDAGYTDALGDRRRLLEDLRELREQCAKLAFTLGEVSVARGQTELDPRVLGRLDVECPGKPRWKVTGPLEIDLVKEGDFRVRSGLLTDLRDVRKLAEARRAALEGNDADGYAKLLHPTYRDGDVDREETTLRLQRDLAGVRVRLEPSLYRLELRGPTAHLDEHYVLTVGERTLPPGIARLTLTRAAGLWKISSGLYPGNLK